jgi:GNAT superfamily N-acetyltransferase
MIKAHRTSLLRTKSCGERSPFHPDDTLARALDKHVVEWIEAHAAVPRVEVHRDQDATWMVQPGFVWNNVGAGLAFAASNVDERLDRIIGRFRDNGRGAGFWVSDHSTPHDLPDRLRQRGFRCRKYWPGMHADLREARSTPPRPAGIELRVIRDHAPFARGVHPSFGRITTPIRRFELDRLAALVRADPERTWDFVAFAEGEPAGACTLYGGAEVAGLWDVAVVESRRNRGIGTALVAHACSFARKRGFAGAVLIASGMGESMYHRVGFRKVCEIGFFYSALQPRDTR